MDMVNLKGMPLTISVFTFGLAAAFASFVLGRWNKTPAGENAQDKPSPGNG
jgi:FlaG/FlaF family flagellin (archaellin)